MVLVAVFFVLITANNTERVQKAKMLSCFLLAVTLEKKQRWFVKMAFCLSKENTQVAEIFRTKQNKSVPY